MTELGKTVRILFPDGHERVFYNASIDMSVDGWLQVTRLDVQEAPLSGVTEPIAGYRLDALLGWEYAEPDERIHTTIEWSERGGSAESGENGDGNGK